MSDLDTLKIIEAQLNESLTPCALDTLMHGNARCCYALNETEQVIGLNLQNCQLSNINFLKRFKQLIRLNLNFNKISKLSALKELYFLKQLTIQKNAISDMSPLKPLINLQYLNCQDNQISDLKFLKELTQLTSLNCQANQISQLNVFELNNLSSLNLSSNKITNISALSVLQNLTVLNINSNNINTFHSLEHLDTLVELDLRFNQLQKIEPLAQLKKLHTLYLSSNEISELEPLQELTQLSRLFLSSNKISQLQPLQKLHNLIELDLRFNYIVDLSPLEQLTQLNLLYLEHNQIRDIAVLKNLQNLSLINLRNNQIKEIEAVRHLSNLQQLYLSQNKIEILAEWIVDLNLKVKWSIGGDGISLSGNPISIPPQEIICQGNSAIKTYFKAMAQQQRGYLNEVRVFLVGETGVGKTSLARLLRGEAFNAQEPKTQHLAIGHLQCADIKLHLWDFAGDSIFQASQRFFFSANTVYILVVDASSHKSCAYWLKKIAYFANDVPILVVFNKADKAQNHVIDSNGLIKLYSGLNENSFFTLSCAKDIGVSGFKQILLHTIKQLPMIKNSTLASWLHIRAALLERQKSQPFISQKNYQQLCEKYGLEEPENQQQLAQLLHQLGVCLYFEKNALSGAYLIEPTWFIYHLHGLLTRKELVHNHGKFSLRSLMKLAKQQNRQPVFSVKKYRYFIQLLLKQQMVYLDNSRDLFMPELFSLQQPVFEFNQKDGLRFRFYVYYLDDALLNQLIAALHEDVVLGWKTGGLLKNEALNSEALVKIDFAENKITLCVTGDKKRAYFAQMQQVLQSIVMLK